MSDYVIMPKQDYEDVCNAVRAKTGKTDLLTSVDLCGEIENLKADPTLQEKTITENGEYTADEGYDGLSKVTVNVASENKLTHYFNKTITEITHSDMEGVNQVPELAFAGHTNLLSVSLPDNVCYIGKEAFSQCNKMTSIDIGDGVWKIDEKAFYQCTLLENVRLGNALTTIAMNVFLYCYGLKNIVIPDSVTTIQNMAFSDCYYLETMTMGKGVTSIGSSAFYKCSKLATLNISDLDAWFNITFGSSNGNPLYYAKKFYLNDEIVTDITIGESITSIKNYVLYNNTSVTKITFPSGITSVGTQAFYGCSGLTLLDFRAATVVPTLANTNAFTSVPTTAQIVVPDALYDEWIAATNWASKASMIYKASEVTIE